MPERPPTVGTPSLLRAINARTILEHIQRTGPVSRAQVARDSGLSKPTVSLGLTALLDADLVREVGRSSGRPGPSAVLYELNPSAGWVVGIDVGRRRVRAALADITGTVVARRDEPARASSARTLIGQLGAIAHGLAAEAGIGWDQVHHVTVGSPGVFEPTRGAVTLAPNLPGWGRQGLLLRLRDELGSRIGVENDVNLAAEGERWRGLARGVRNFGFLSVGTGVGMGLVLDGKLYRGASGAAGEVGYLPIGADPYDRQVRRRGAFEEAINGAAVVRAASGGRHGRVAQRREGVRAGPQGRPAGRTGGRGRGAAPRPRPRRGHRGGRPGAGHPRRRGRRQRRPAARPGGAGAARPLPACGPAWRCRRWARTRCSRVPSPPPWPSPRRHLFDPATLLDRKELVV